MPSGEVGLLFALPAVVLLGMDWVEGGFRDNDFALGADTVLMLSSPGVYSVFLVMLRRMASLLTRASTERPASLSAAVYVVVPPVSIGIAIGMAQRFAGWQPAGTSAVAAAVCAGTLYVVLDALFGLLARARAVYWPWALPANLNAYGLLWASQVSLAVMAELTLGALGLLAVWLFTLLAVLLRVAYGLVRRLLRLYGATAEALAATLEATLPSPSGTELIANSAAGTATELGLPESDAALVSSAAWVRSIVIGGFPASGTGSFLGGDHLALADPLNVVEASEGDSPDVSPRLRRLGLVLCASVPEDPDQEAASVSRPARDELVRVAEALERARALVRAGVQDAK